MNENQNNLKLWKFDEKDVRTVELNGVTWWVAKDVCDILDIGNPSKALYGLNDKEKSTLTIGKGGPERNIINESGLFALIFKSRKPEAEKFRLWVTGEVLPQIRKTGSYSVLSQDDDVSLEIMTLRVIYGMQDKIKSQSALIAEQKPKAEFFDTVTQSKSESSAQEVAGILAVRGMGRNNLIEFLKNKKVLIDSSTPYRDQIDAGRMRIVEKKFNDPITNEIRLAKKVVYTQKGVDYIRQLLGVNAPFQELATA